MTQFRNNLNAQTKQVGLFVIFIMLYFGSCIDVFAQSADELAIVALLEKEAATWKAGDIEGHAECWKVQPYSRILVSTSQGTLLDVPPEVMIHPAPEMLGKGGNAKFSNIKMHIDGNSAWVNHDETSTSTDGKKTLSHEFRILEKIDGRWKLVGQSIHQYPSKEN